MSSETTLGGVSDWRYDQFCDLCLFNDGQNEHPCSICEWDRNPATVPTMYEYDQKRPSTMNPPDKIPGAKSDVGKLKLSDVPPEIIEAVAKVREFGNRKYSDPENWKRVDPEKFHDAMLRHVLHSWTDWRVLDEESGLPAIFHIACNAAFLIAFWEAENGKE